MLRRIIYVLLAVVVILAVVLAARFLLNRGAGEGVATEDMPGLVEEDMVADTSQPSYPVNGAPEGETAVVSPSETGVDDSAVTTDQTASPSEGEATGEGSGDTSATDESAADSATTDDNEAGGGAGEMPFGGDADSADDAEAGGGIIEEESSEPAAEDAEVGGGGGEEAESSSEAATVEAGTGGSAAPTTAFATPGVPVQHMVYQYEWLMQIARCYGTTVHDIRSANYIPIPDRIYPGTLLTIPNPGSVGPITINEMPCFVFHVVQQGENLSQIAQAYGINLHWLARINAIYNYNYVQAGKLLVIPNPVPPELTMAPTGWR